MPSSHLICDPAEPETSLTVFPQLLSGRMTSHVGLNISTSLQRCTSKNMSLTVTFLLEHKSFPATPQQREVFVIEHMCLLEKQGDRRSPLQRGRPCHNSSPFSSWDFGHVQPEFQASEYGTRTVVGHVESRNVTILPPAGPKQESFLTCNSEQG